MKTFILTTVSALLIVAAHASAGTIDFTNGGPDKTTTGDALDETGQGDLPRAAAVAESAFDGAGLTVTITAFTGLAGDAETTTADDVNATSHSLGINSGLKADGTNDDDTAEFDAGESLTFSFNKNVVATQFLFSSIMDDDGDRGTLTVGDTDYPLTPESTDGGSDLAFPKGLAIPAGTPITVTGQRGTFGMQGVELEVAP